MKAFYSEESIRALEITTDTGKVEFWGRGNKSYQQKIWNFDYAHELIGFRGVGALDTISSLGLIILDKKSCENDAPEEIIVEHKKEHFEMYDDPRFNVVVMGCIFLLLVFTAIIVFLWSIVWNSYA